MEQGQFIELLSDLVKIGEAQDNRLTKEEISRYFADLDLAERADGAPISVSGR